MFILKILITKDNSIYRKVSYIIIYPYYIYSLRDLASITLIELIRSVKESIRNFSSILAYSRTLYKIKSRYLIYFNLSKFAKTKSSSIFINRGS